jgi:hypothetical protein
MAYFLNEEQEFILNEFLVNQNQQICEKQILEDNIPKEFRDLIQKTMDSGSPIPFFDPLVGYYTVSFTPCDKGDRIYVHHHLTGKSISIYDPALVVVDTSNEEEDEEEESPINIEDIDNDSEVESRDKISNVQVDEDGIYTPN